MNRQDLETLIGSLRDAQREYWSVRFGLEHDVDLGPSASEQEVELLTRLLGAELPPSYRLFLALHNRWPSFVGDAHILSLADRKTSSIAAQIRGFKALGLEHNDRIVVDAFVIVAGESSHYLAFLDAGSPRENGELDVVEWTYEDGEIARYPDFGAYLEAQLNATNQLITKEKNSQTRES